jgi:hypothetical protein
MTLRTNRSALAATVFWGRSLLASPLFPLAVFDYNQRAAVDEKVAGLNAGKKGTFFLQIVKDALPLVAAQAE